MRTHIPGKEQTLLGCLAVLNEIEISYLYTIMILENGFILSFPEDLAFDDDALLAFCAANPELRIERDENKQLIIMSPTGSLAASYHHIIHLALGIWNSQNSTGIVFDASAGFRLPDTSIRAADLAWLSRKKWDALSKEQKQKFAPICPEFIVEVKSPSDSWAELQRKMEAWSKNGVLLGWLIDVEKEKALVYHESTVDEISNFNHKLEGGVVLPGFEFDLGTLKDV
ncbi:MAG: Uma2 family endonuclease [Bacteroidota bacterium]